MVMDGMVQHLQLVMLLMDQRSLLVVLIVQTVMEQIVHLLALL